MNVERAGIRGKTLLALAALALVAACVRVEGPAAVASNIPQATHAVHIIDAPVSPDDLRSFGIDSTVSHSLRFTDQHGEYAAAFSRHATHEEDPDDETILDRITLTAQIRPASGDRTGNQPWQHSAVVECDGVDIEADFYPETFSVTDLDGDGTAELTFAYHRFCGGGIDPRDVTVVLQEGDNRYILEGQSLVQVGDDPAFGGGFSMDDALNKAPSWLQDQMLATWEQVRQRKVPDASQ